MSVLALSEVGIKSCGFVFGLFYWKNKDFVFKRQISPAVIELKDGSRVEINMSICETPDDIAGCAQALVNYTRPIKDYLPMVENTVFTKWQKMRALLIGHGWTETDIEQALELFKNK